MSVLNIFGFNQVQEHITNFLVGVSADLKYTAI